jgi:hypothetical protein
LVSSDSTFGIIKLFLLHPVLKIETHIIASKNVDIEFSAHGAFLEQPLSGTFLEQPLSGTFLE